ncbi:hypothetical protein MRB53_020818 [Persea americana]|uniref:Uncharacterized protein n=1 Tax=Persea americana TaxID=3435 RepID=A0ACC2L2A3_PERAE|nr:hypothetical protein MRB53_020818 [Persea americana]
MDTPGLSLIGEIRGCPPGEDLVCSIGKRGFGVVAQTEDLASLLLRKSEAKDLDFRSCSGSIVVQPHRRCSLSGRTRKTAENPRFVWFAELFGKRTEMKKLCDGLVLWDKRE